WTAAGRLSAVNFAGRIIDQSNLRELLEGFLHFADEAAAGHGNDDVLRRPPAELFGNLETDRFGPFSIEGPEADVDKPPTVFECILGTQPIDLVISAGDSDDFSAIHAGADDFGGLQVAGDEDIALQS